MGTGSRSGLLGAALTLVVLQTGPSTMRVPRGSVIAGIVLSVVVTFTLAPQRAVERMLSFFPQDSDAIGASSIEMREQTIATAWQIIEDNPVWGVGLGNFREMARQVYADRWFRPPHNSFIWAMAEGGVAVVLAYLLLFWVTWRDLTRAIALRARDPVIGILAAGTRAAFFVFLFFGLFADLWLNPMTYVLLGMAISMRRYLEEVAEPTQVRVRSARPGMLRGAVA
jgi:O-antigen ligase